MLSKARDIHGICCSCMYLHISCLELGGREGGREGGEREGGREGGGREGEREGVREGGRES